MNIATKVSIAVAVLIIVFLVIILRKPKPTYKLEIKPCEKTQAISADSIESVKIFLETSLSMKGYVNRQSVIDSGYVIKTVVPYLITDCRGSLCQPELWTISIAPQRYIRSEDEFITNLRSGQLMQPGNTQIHLILQHVIESNQPGELSFLISDFIPDLGAGQRVEDLEMITTTIYDVLRSKQSISAALFQYYSEFNGDWYYDRQGWSRPFDGRNINMHNRPLYIWIFGKPELIDAALKQGVLSENRVPFQNSYYYRDGFCLEIPFKILNYPIGGKIAIAKSGDAITIVKTSPTMPVSFTIGLDLNNVPKFISNTNYLAANLKFDKNHDHLNTGNEIKLYDQSSIKSATNYYNKIAPDIDSKSLTHFISITLGNIDPQQDVEFSLVLENNEPSWIENAHIRDDLEIPAEDLEGMTFAYRYISEGFKKRFNEDKDNPNDLFEIQFKLISK